MKRTVLSVAAAVVCSSAALGQQIKGDIHVAREGETVTVDLGLLAAFAEGKASKIKVQLVTVGRMRKEKAVLAEAKHYQIADGDTTVEVRYVRAFDERMTVLADDSRLEVALGKDVIVINPRLAEKRCFTVKAHRTKDDDAKMDIVQVTWCDTGAGDWSCEAPKGYAVSAKGAFPTVNGIDVRKVKKMMSATTAKSGFLLTYGENLPGE